MTSPSTEPTTGPNNPQALFFDAAGTLFELRESVGATYARLAGGLGVSVAPESLDAAFRKSWKALPPPLRAESAPNADDDRSWWKTLVVNTFGLAASEPIEPYRMDVLFDQAFAYYAKADAWKLFDDVRPTLDALQGRYRLLVLSNFDSRLRSVLGGLGLTPYFERIIVSSEVGAAKPHPRMFETALRACGLPPSACLHIGDDARCDDEGARQMGLRSFLLDRPTVTLATLLEKLQEVGGFSLAKV